MNFIILELFPSIVQAVLNLNFIQALLLLLDLMSEKQKGDIKKQNPNHLESLSDYLSFIINRFKYPFIVTVCFLFYYLKLFHSL